MKTTDILVLVGQIVQILASFILSIEVIGLDRVEGWARWLSLLRSDWDQEGEDPPFFSLVSLVRLLVSAFTALGMAMVGYYLIKRVRPELDLSNWHTGWVNTFFALSAKIGGAVAWQALLFGIRGVVAGLRKINALSVAKKSRLVGFVVLFVGFVLQFIGTIGQTVPK